MFIIQNNADDAHAGTEEPTSDDDDIPMPPGVPPGTEEVTSDDDIQMPDGPPPGQVDEGMSNLVVSATPALNKYR